MLIVLGLLILSGFQLSVESKSFRFALRSFTTLCDWLKKFAPPTRPIRCKTKDNVTWFSRAWRRLRVFASSFYWFVLLFMFAVIGHCDIALVLVLRATLNWKLNFNFSCDIKKFGYCWQKSASLFSAVNSLFQFYGRHILVVHRTKTVQHGGQMHAFYRTKYYCPVVSNIFCSYWCTWISSLLIYCLSLEPRDFLSHGGAFEPTDFRFQFLSCDRLCKLSGLFRVS